MRERGEGEVKIIVTIAIAAYGLLAAARLLPAWSDDKAMNQRVGEVLKFAGTNQWGTKDLINQITIKAGELNIQFKPEDLKVTEDGKQLHATLTYERVVPLPLYTYRKTIAIDQQYTKY